MKRETEIHNMKIKNKVTYAEAVKRVEQARASGSNVRGEVVTGKYGLRGKNMLKKRRKRSGRKRRI